MKCVVLGICALSLTAPLAVADPGQFSTLGYKIYDPNGNEFIARGINVPGFNYWVNHDATADAATLADAWNFNLIRATCLPITPPDLPGASINMENMVKAYTTDRIAAGKQPLVVMLEAYESVGKYFEGQDLVNVTAWWRDQANRYKNNPYVWFNVGNEPGNKQKPADWPADQPWDIFQPDQAKWENMHQTVIKAIREDIGAKNVIVADGIDFGQDGTWDDLGTLRPDHSAIIQYGKNLTDFNGKHYDNIVFDTHVYGMWVSPGSTPDRLRQYINATRAQGLPLIFGEWGYNQPATPQMAQDMLDLSRQYGIGRAAWSWSDSGDSADLTTSSDPSASGSSWETGGGYLIDSVTTPTNLSAFGQLVWADTHGTFTANPDLPGDANFNAHIDPSDYALLDRGLALHLTGYANGDFNHDGAITPADYLIIDQSLAVQSGGTLSPDFLAARQAEFGEAYVSTLLASVPEPGTAALFAFLSVSIATRRRPNRR